MVQLCCVHLCRLNKNLAEVKSHPGFNCWSSYVVRDVAAGQQECLLLVEEDCFYRVFILFVAEVIHKSALFGIGQR